MTIETGLYYLLWVIERYLLGLIENGFLYYITGYITQFLFIICYITLETLYSQKEKVSNPFAHADAEGKGFNRLHMRLIYPQYYITL